MKIEQLRKQLAISFDPEAFQPIIGTYNYPAERRKKLAQQAEAYRKADAEIRIVSDSIVEGVVGYTGTEAQA